MITEALTLACDMGARLNMVHCLDSFASLLSAEGNHSTAARLWGANQAQKDRTGERRSVAMQLRIERDQELARRNVGHDAFNKIWAEGLNSTVEEAAAQVLSSVTSNSNQASLS